MKIHGGSDAPLVLESLKGVSTYNIYIDPNNGIGVLELHDGDGSEPYRRGLTPEQLVELGIGLLTAANHFRDGHDNDDEPQMSH
jgi:hypothetical protein